MLSDAPRYVSVENDKTAEHEADEILSFFQSKLK